jgi:gliding motility-associated-like protein
MSVALHAQLTAPGMSSVRTTTYPSNILIKDPIFIYCNSSGTQKGTIQAVSPGGTGPFDFSWYKWSDITRSFSIFLKTDAARYTSDFPNLDEGGYKVRITDGGGYDTSLVGWIHLDKPFAEAKLNFFDCDRVFLYGKAVIDTFYYKDIGTGAFIKLVNSINLTWSSNPSSIIFPLLPQPQYPDLYKPAELPYEDVTYKINVIDDFGCTNESSFFYKSIHVKADYSITPNKGEAPLEVSFKDKSIRASIYKWDFGDKTSWTDSVPGVHTYYRPGTYYPKLIVESSLTCIDSVRIDSVFVEPSKLDIPNVFTPDGDGNNDLFIVESKSLRSLNVEIFSRSGIMVYSFYGEGDRLKEWQGWDGNINKSSAKASPGVYYYIIRAAGWDEKMYDSKAYRGFLYLYR